MDSDKPRRGRPPGVRNRPKDELGVSIPPARLRAPSTKPLEDYDHADPDTIVSRQLTMLDWAQQAMRNEMKRAMQADGKWISAEDISKLEKLSQAIVRAIDALKRSDDLAKELSARMSPEQLLDAAIKKVEAQDIATLNYAIKRLRAHRERIAPVGGMDKIQMGEGPKLSTASDAIADLVDE